MCHSLFDTTTLVRGQNSCEDGLGGCPCPLVESGHTQSMPEFESDRPLLSIGQPASPGCITGTARLIDVEDTDGGVSFTLQRDGISAGDVLILDTLSPQVAEPAKRAAGIVTIPTTPKQRRRAGLTSRAAIFAREVGIPAVVGAEEFRDRIENGQALIVDGDNGEIRASQFS